MAPASSTGRRFVGTNVVLEEAKALELSSHCSGSVVVCPQPAKWNNTSLNLNPIN